MFWNPLIWLHCHLDRNVRNGLIGVGVYVVAMFVGLSLGLYYNPREAYMIHGIFLAITTGAQAVFALILVPAGIRKYVQRDFTTGVIESHRLTPLANRSLILGFITGPALQGLVFYAASALLGLYFSFQYAGSPGLGGKIGVQTAVGGWFFLQIVLLTLAFFVANLILLAAITTQGKTNWIGGVFVAMIFGGWAAFFAIPGLSLLLGLMGIGVLISIIQKGMITGDESAAVIGVFFQFVLALFIFAGACRRVRRPDRPTFSIRLGLGLLIAWGALLVTGIYWMPRFPVLFDEWQNMGHLQLIASVATAMLIALAPLASAAWSSIHPEIGESRTPVTTCAVTAIAIGILTFIGAWMMAIATDPGQMTATVAMAFRLRQTLVLIAVVLTINAWTDYHFLVWFMAREKKLVLNMVGMMFVFKVLPPALDSLLDALVNNLTEYEWTFGYLSACSPIGTMIGIGDDLLPLTIGTGVQLLIAALIFRAARSARQRYQQGTIVQSVTDSDLPETQTPTPV